MAFYRIKKRKLWLIKAFDRGARKTVARVLGNRDSATCRRLYDKVSHLKDRAFYTDAWRAFADVLPADRHIIGKAHTLALKEITATRAIIWPDFTRRTKMVSARSRLSKLHCGFGRL